MRAYPAMTSRAAIAAAAERIAGYVRRTPVLRLGPADLGLGRPLALKLEALQHAGSFKPR
ncbi:MAG: threonine/serine dehydratase, partial [Acetobacteraceae bacterium]|nr:threonine/serine dehydratase [Acetobacteraceae bacterium]